MLFFPRSLSSQILTVKLSNYPAHNPEDQYAGRGSYSTYGTGVTGETQYTEGESRASGSYAISPLSAYSTSDSPMNETPAGSGGDTGRQSRGQQNRVKDDIALEGIEEE